MASIGVSKMPSTTTRILCVVLAIVVVQLAINSRLVKYFELETEISFKKEGQAHPSLSQQSAQSQQSPQYSFEMIPSRKWDIYPHPFPCHPPRDDEENRLMLTTPTREGILFQRPLKVGSTTMNNILLRLVHNRAEKAASSTDDAKTWKMPARCVHRAMHGSSIELDYGQRNKEKSFLFSMVRDPTKRAISEYFHFKVSAYQDEPTNTNFAKYVIRAGANNVYLRSLTFDSNLDKSMSIEYEHFLKAHQDEQKRLNLTSSIQIREPVERFLRQKETAIDYTKIVQGILDDYDFIAVTERMNESLVAMKLLLGLSMNEIVYAKISRSAGSFSNGFFAEGRPCIYLIPSFLTTHMKDFFYTPHKNEKWIAYSKGDALLHQAANRSLDRTIDEVFGRERFDQEMEEFQNALAYTQAICESEPDLVLGMCDDGGNSVVKDPNRSTTCYIWGEGCDKECINKKVPSPIPRQVLEGTLKFGE